MKQISKKNARKLYPKGVEIYFLEKPKLIGKGHKPKKIIKNGNFDYQFDLLQKIYKNSNDANQKVRLFIK